ncbi:MAG: hypothetical protein K2X82_22295 [Gemmataceae bacterium]|nr:hypothetical protein [Gemmataceae bacterium]
MSLAPDVRTPTDLDLAPEDPSGNGSPRPGLSLGGPAGSGPRTLPGSARRRGRAPLVAAGVAFLVLAGGVAAFVLTRAPSARPDVLTHKVKREALKVTVTEKGTLESAQNADLICKIKAGSKGQQGYSTSIKWVIEAGSPVEPGQLLMILDDSALQDSYRDQSIKVDEKLAAKVKAERDYDIAVKENERAVAVEKNNVQLADIDLEKYTGLSVDPDRAPLASVAGAPALLVEKGEFQQKLDELTGKVRLEESNVQQYRERSAWADRMTKMKYLSDAQADSERSKLASGVENLRNFQAQRQILIDYDRKKMLADLRSKAGNARLLLAQKELEAEAKREQLDIDRRTKISVYNQELEKLKEINDQLNECRLYSPQKGIVVYYVNESGRWGQQPQGMIEQGAQVKEGQKMLRIPNLSQMQVNTKVHEAMVGRIRGDQRVATGLVDQMKVGMLSAPDPFARLVSQHDGFVDDVKRQYRDHEYHTTALGQAASVRVDARPDKVYPARVKSVAGVASQADSWISDVKLYDTLVLIDDPNPGLKPGGTAEVTIHVDGMPDVLAVPIQAVVGGAELGAARKVWVKAGDGYAGREVKLGMYNDRMVEVQEGLAEGDEVVINPKVLMGDAKAKTRDGGDGKGEGGGDGKKGFDPSKFDPSKMKGGMPGGGAPGGGKGGGKGGKGGAPGGGPPAG